MLKKLFTVCLTIILVCLIIAMLVDFFTDPAPTSIVPSAIASDGRFIVVEDQEWNGDYKIVYDRYTFIMYTLSRGSYNKGTFTLLVNADGLPLIYNGE